MSNLSNAIKEEMKWDSTDNGAVALNTTSNKCLDLFGRAGSIRNMDITQKQIMFDEAFKEDANIAVKVLFYIRDIRGGYGERDTFKEMLPQLALLSPESVKKNLWAILEFGRASDLYCLTGTQAEDAMWDFMKEQFELDYENMKAGKSVSLLAKWIATPDSKVRNTAKLGVLTAKHLGYTYKNLKEYRLKLRELRRYLDLPEAKMCAGKWNEIEYSKCASKFLLKHRNAIMKHDGGRWLDYLESVNKGEDKINTGTLTPCDIIDKVYTKYDSSLEVMWDNLEDVCTDEALVICDTSGSMWWNRSGNGGPYPGSVAYALAMYFAERNKGDLKNLFMTFSGRPKFVEIKGTTLKQKVNSINKAEWGGSTDLEASFELLLNTAKKANLSQEDLPKALIIVSDMQINCVDGIDKNNRMTFYDTMVQRYEAEGYKMPQVVFWNVNANKATFHASADSAGVSLVSGFSVNVFKNVMDNIGTTPLDLMMAVINSERYAKITV